MPCSGDEWRWWGRVERGGALEPLATHRVTALLAVGCVFAACGGRSEKTDSATGEPASEAGNGAQLGGTTVGGSTSTGVAGALGGKPEQGASGEAASGAVAAAGGEPSDGGQGGVGGESTGEGAAAGDHAGGGAAGAPASVEVLLGDYDVYLASPPAIAGCSVAWYEPRLNLAVSSLGSGKVEALAFPDFFWQANFAAEPTVGPSTINLAAVADWAGLPLAPALSLAWDAQGFSGGGTAEIPYTCEAGLTATYSVPVSIETDRTSPKLRVDPGGYPSFGFTRFGFTFSEPVELPSGSFSVTFREPADGEAVVELYDVDSGVALPAIWKWSLGGPVALANFADPASVEGLTIGARVIAQASDRAGNALISLEQIFDIEQAAVLETQLDFDQRPTAGIYGNASYHSAAGPGAECEQGGCLVLDGPVARCYDQPRSTFAVRLTSPWTESLQVRYRVWASSYSVSPIAIGFASGCSGSASALLTPLAQAQGAFTHVSEWQTLSISPCGGPENETGFTLSLGCAEYEPPPDVRVVVERIWWPE